VISTSEHYLVNIVKKPPSRAEVIMGVTGTGLSSAEMLTVRQYTVGRAVRTRSPRTAGAIAETGTGYIPITLLSEMAALKEENVRLRAEVERLRSLHAPQNEAVDIDASAQGADMAADHAQQILDKESAKQAILNVLAVGEVFTYSHLLAKLNIDLELLVEACEALAQEGKIGERRPAA